MSDHLPHRPTQPASLWRRLGVWLTLVGMLCVAGFALAQTGANKFDHLKTGFPLTGKHSTVRCETCHTNGVFKGTPKDCRSCHSPGNRPSQNTVVLPANHIPTTLTCDVCHGTQSFTSVRFSHTTGISPGQACATCHDGSHAQGKGPNHVVTRAACDSCHTTARWDGAKPDHSGFNSSTNCASCHNGATASGKSGSHIPVTANCFSCHATTSWKPSKWAHANGIQVKGTCATCHTGSYPPADGKSTNHIPYAALAGVNVSNCDSCHRSGTYSSWADGKFHSNITVTRQCETCHLGSSFGLTARPNDTQHAGVTGNCEGCHTAGSTWTPSASAIFNGKPDHSGFNSATACSNCHNGIKAGGKSVNHIPVADSVKCGSCHNVSGWTPTTWNHSQVTVKGSCTTCHTGAYPPAGGKPSDHIPYSNVSASAGANCDKCHTSAGSGYKSWNPGKFHANITVTTACATCHNGGYNGPHGKSATHIPYAQVSAAASAGCETCHKGSFTNWATGKLHSSVTVSSQCESCHLNATYGLTTRPNDAQHTGVVNGCEGCHKSAGSSWATSGGSSTKPPEHPSFGASTTCATCHNGTRAMGKSANHIPVSSSLNCYSCHNVSTWTPTKWNHTQATVKAACSSCHTGTYGGPGGKPANHIPYASVAASSGANCDSCHKGGYASWNPGQFHANFTVTTTCATCHNGGYIGPQGKSATHIPYAQVSAAASAGCETCHKGSFTSWATGKLHSSVTVTSQCESCHLNATYGLTTRPNDAQHTGVVNGCEGCHKSAGSSWAASGNGIKPAAHPTFNAATNCASCHNGVGAMGKPGNHIPAGTLNCYSCHSVSTWMPTKWNHTQTTVKAACSSCHTGGYAGPGGKPADHIPYASVAVSSGANCDSCHKGGYASWNPGQFHVNFTVTTSCATCHTGGYNGPDGKPGNHIPYAQVSAAASAGCETCHKGSFTSWATGKLHSSVTVSSQCESCHLNATYGLTTRPNDTQHAGVVNRCEGCHNAAGSSWATVGGSATKPLDHNTYGAATTCASCHNGTRATGKVPTHVPTTANCFSCHNVSTWTPTKWNHNVAGVTVKGACSTCHTGSYPPADGKPGNHIPYANVTSTSSANCDSCHKAGYASWNPGQLHANFPALTGQCASCHTGSYLGPQGKPGNHIPYVQVTASATAGCETCHKGSFTSWATGKFHTNVTTVGQCASCHLTSAYGLTAKPADPKHAVVTGTCERCHGSTTNWSIIINGGKPDHSTFNATTPCINCHVSGGSGTAKPGNHIPTSATCFSCHNVTGWTPTKWNHNVSGVTVANACSTCHTGAYAGADGKPANHIPYAQVSVSSAANCDKCHKAGYTNWNPGKFHLYNAGVTTQCATCHNGSYLGASTKSASHIPYASVTASASAACETCHKSTTDWSTGKFHTSVTVTSQCNVCHSTSSYGQMVKPSNHIPLAQLLNGTTLDCSACHKLTTTGGFATATMNHNSSQGAGSGWCKGCHLSSTAYLGNMEKKSTSHLGGRTDCSTSGCHRPLGTRGTTYRSW